MNGVQAVLFVQRRQGLDRVGMHDMQGSAPSSEVTVQALRHVKFPLQMDRVDIWLPHPKGFKQQQANQRPTRFCSSKQWGMITNAQVALEPHHVDGHVAGSSAGSYEGVFSGKTREFHAKGLPAQFGTGSCVDGTRSNGA
jgi:hypothetical protein